MVTNKSSQIIDFTHKSNQSNIIASKRINYKNIAANVLDWTTGCSASNTIYTGWLFKKVNPSDVATLSPITILTAGIIGDTLNSYNLGVTITQNGLKSVTLLANEFVIAGNIVLGGVYLSNVAGAISILPSQIGYIQAPDITSTGSITLNRTSFSSIVTGMLLDNTQTGSYNFGPLFSSNLPFVFFDSQGNDKMYIVMPNSTYESNGLTLQKSIGNWSFPLTEGLSVDYFVDVFIMGIIIPT